MNRIKFIDRMATGRINRRDMLTKASAFGVGLAYFPRLPKAAEVLTCLEWAGYDDASYFKPFADKHGAPNFSIFSGEEDALDQDPRRVRSRRNASLQLFREPLRQRQGGCGDRHNEAFSLEGRISRSSDGQRRCHGWQGPSWRRQTGATPRSPIGRTLSDDAYKSNESWDIFYYGQICREGLDARQ